MVGVAAERSAGELAEDGGAPGAGVLERLEHEDAGALWREGGALTLFRWGVKREREKGGGSERKRGGNRRGEKTGKLKKKGGGSSSSPLSFSYLP